MARFEDADTKVYTREEVLRWDTGRSLDDPVQVEVTVTTTVTVEESKEEQLIRIAQYAATKLQQQLGSDANIVVLIDLPYGGHSHPVYWYEGQCLPVIGLLEVGTKMIRGSMPEEYQA